MKTYEGLFDDNLPNSLSVLMDLGNFKKALAEHDAEIIKIIDEMIENIDSHKILVSNERKQSYEIALTELKERLNGSK